MKIFIPVSLGELYDKISILEIKIVNLEDPIKIANVVKEYKELRTVANQYPIDIDFYNRLLEVNKKLWDIEDGIRECEKNKQFDQKFIDLARAVYLTNDPRSEIKKEINLKYGSELVEEKSYRKY